MENVTLLSLDGNPLTNSFLLGAKTNLETLLLNDVAMTNCDFVTNLTALQWLELQRNGILDLHPLASLTNLERLYVEGNRAADLSFLANPSRLKSLNINLLGLRSISRLSEATNIDFLMIQANQIQDLTPLASLAQLRLLYAGGNLITNICVLTNCPDLRTLWVGGNYLYDTNYSIAPDSWDVLRQIVARGGGVQAQNQRLWGAVRLAIVPRPGGVLVRWEPDPPNLAFHFEQSTNGTDWTLFWPGEFFDPVRRREIVLPTSESNALFRTVLGWF